MLSSLSAPARLAASWEMPSSRSPSPQKTHVRLATPFLLAARASPTPIAMPWPSGPVVTSTPGVTPRSGCPAQRLPHWRNAMSSSILSPPMPERWKSAYTSDEACPPENTRRSRSAQDGSFGSTLRCLSQRTVARSAIPIGAPGCPDFAFSTMSAQRQRIVLAVSLKMSSVSFIFLYLLLSFFRFCFLRNIIPYSEASRRRGIRPPCGFLRTRSRRPAPRPRPRP